MSKGRLCRGSRDLKNELDFEMPSSVQKLTLTASYEKAGGVLGAGLQQGHSCREIKRAGEKPA